MRVGFFFLLMLIALQASATTPWVLTDSTGSPKAESAAPNNDTPHRGNMNGVQIAVPMSFWASVDFLDKEGRSIPQSNNPTDDFHFAIPTISLALRLTSFEPIISHQDLIDWANNHLKPYGKADPMHRWIEVRFQGDLFRDTNGSLNSQFQRNIDHASEHFGPLSCEPTLKYGLKHCISRKEDGPAEPNEFYFDRDTKQSFIQCVRLKSVGYGPFLTCEHRILVPAISAVAVVWYGSDEEISNWMIVSEKIREIGPLLRAQ
jgi:hypothetical protein